VAERTTEMKETQTLMAESLLDDICSVVKYVHWAITLLSGS